VIGADGDAVSDEKVFVEGERGRRGRRSLLLDLVI
jgi:hypothetical protein